MNQPELARLAGVTKSAVHQWETGATKNIRPAPLLKAAKALRVRPEWLIFGDKPMEAGKGLSDAAVELGRLYDGLPEPGKREFFDYAHFIVDRIAENHGRSADFSQLLLRLKQPDPDKK